MVSNEIMGVLLLHKDYINLPLKRRLDKIRERIFFLLRPYEKEKILKDIKIT
jgi:DNA helicase-2/ATP-dependent DNA helicase PcrA